MRTATLVAALLGVVAGCGPENRSDGDGTDGDSDSDTNTDSDSDADMTDGNDGTFPDAADGCSDEAKLVYVVDTDNTLYTFAPTTKQFTALGTLDCNPGADPSGLGEATPFSMAVDRDSNAYILFSNSKIFKVDTQATPLTCQNMNYVPQMGLELFGMGFSTDQAGGTEDKLFITGGPFDPLGGSPEDPSSLAVLDINTMQVTAAGTVPGSPELTGNSNAELWGFFTGNNPRVGKLNKGTGVLDTTYMPGGMLQGEPRAWAFAFWGGDYWVFLMKTGQSSTTVYQVNGSTGAIDSYTAAPGKTIVGAGVSTCAPVVVGRQ